MVNPTFSWPTYQIQKWGLSFSVFFLTLRWSVLYFHSLSLTLRVKGKKMGSKENYEEKLLNFWQLLLVFSSYFLPNCSFIQTKPISPALYLESCNMARNPPPSPFPVTLFSDTKFDPRNVLHQALREVDGLRFLMLEDKMPEWFDNSTDGHSICFWIRNKFPNMAVCFAEHMGYHGELVPNGSV